MDNLLKEAYDPILEQLRVGDRVNIYDSASGNEWTGKIKEVKGKPTMPSSFIIELAGSGLVEGYTFEYSPYSPEQINLAISPTGPVFEEVKQRGLEQQQALEEEWASPEYEQRIKNVLKEENEPEEREKELEDDFEDDSVWWGAAAASFKPKRKLCWGQVKADLNKL